MSWLPSPEYADWWYDLSWKGIIGFGAVATFATAATVLFTIIQFWSDGIRDERADARNRAMELQVATANERAGEANKKAEEEKLERLKLEAKYAPRRITREVANPMIARLGSFAGKRVKVMSYVSDVEGVVLATGLIQVLQLSGLIVEDGRMCIQPFGSIAFGVFVDGNDAALVQALRAAFAISPVQASEMPIPHGVTAPKVDAIVFVAAKPLDNN